MMRLIYSFCFAVFAVFYLPLFLFKGKHKGGFGSRLGFVPPDVQKALEGRQVIWVHGVSVGEVVQAFRLVGALKKKFGAARFLVTTTTTAGRDVALKLKAGEDNVLYFPADFRFSVRRFLSSVRPSALVLIETEIWPNLLSELSKRKIPAFIVNGRISDRAISRYKKVKFFLAPFLNRLHAIGAQDDLMKTRFIELGADPSIVSVTGNMKFDWQPGHSGEELVKELGHALKGSDTFLLIAGSTHESEEEMLLDLYGSVYAAHPDFRLLIAPRHLERVDSIERAALRKNLRLVRTSRLCAAVSGPELAPAAPVFLLDSMGVLANCYRLADAVFMGGSLVPVGGHNLIEPAFFEKCVLFGPFMNNFSQMAEEFKRSSAGIQVQSAKELKARILELMADRAKGGIFGRRAKQLVLGHQGATDRNLRVLLRSIATSEE